MNELIYAGAADYISVADIFFAEKGAHHIGAMSVENVMFGGIGYISGTVTNAPCSVSLFSKDRAEIKRTKTDGNGHFCFYSLRPGEVFDLRYYGVPNRNDRVHTGVVAGGGI